MSRQMESVVTYPTIGLTPVHKSGLIEGTCDEVDFNNLTWIIPKQRMKASNTQAVCLSH